MDEIICECGHLATEHSRMNCRMTLPNGAVCLCDLSQDLVVTRHQLKQVTAERDDLQQRLDVAREALEVYAVKEAYHGDAKDEWKLAADTLQKLET